MYVTRYNGKVDPNNKLQYMSQENIVTPIETPNPVPDPMTLNKLCPALSELVNTSPVDSANLNVNSPVQIPEQENVNSQLEDNFD